MEPDPSRIAIIVLNWNRRDDTLRCLTSLSEVVEPRVDTIVVDNGSTDGSEAAIRAAFPNIHLIQNGANLGFAEGNNVAIRWALGAGYRWIMLLNNDTVVAPNAIAELLRPLEVDPKIGISSGAVVYMDAPETIWSAGGRIERQSGVVTTDWLDQPLASLPDYIYRADHVTGCAMLLRGEAIRKAGLLDPRFFMYYEETEWCARITRAGYRIVVNPLAVIRHDIHPAAQAGSPTIAYYMTRNHLLFLRATRAPLRAWLHTFYWQARTLASLYVGSPIPARKRGREPMLRAIRDFALGRFGQLQNAR